MELEKKDKELLYELDANSRQSKTQLAKKLKISPQVVDFKFKKIEKSKLITSHYSVIDTAKLGMNIHKCFIKIQNIQSLKKEEELINYLKNHRNIVWLANCDGNFDIAFGIWAKNMQDLDASLREINQNFGEYIGQKEIVSIIKGNYFIRHYLVPKDKQNLIKESFFGTVTQSSKLDRKDWIILNLLGQNSREKLNIISKKIELSLDSTAKRIKRLQKSNIIKHYNIVPNEDVYSYLHYKLLLKMKNYSDSDESKLYLFSKIQENIIYFVKTVGPWDFEIDIEIKDIKEYRELLRIIRDKFQKNIDTYTTLQIIKVHKYNFCPSIPK